VRPPLNGSIVSQTRDSLDQGQVEEAGENGIKGFHVRALAMEAGARIGAESCRLSIALRMA
jgi:hypothetical protein